MRNAICLLWVDDTVGIILGSQISLEAQHKHRSVVTGYARCPSLFVPLRNISVCRRIRFTLVRIGTHHSLEVDQTEPLADVIAEDD